MNQGGKRRLVIHKTNPGAVNDGQTWTTSYPLSLIEHILRIKGLVFLLDEIRRDEDPRYVYDSMVVEILSYVNPMDFAGKRILDFGCGSGASTVVLKRMFPGARIVGVELRPDYQELAAERVQFYGLHDISFFLSPDSMSLPPEIGTFDAIILSAVFEHLLPAERPVLLPELWRHLNPGGIFFIRETPFRYSPVESHSTGLPLINYLPDWLALVYARKSSKINPSFTWETLLRNGIRGGTEGEIMSILKQTDGVPLLMEPSRNGINSRVDLWAHLPTHSRFAAIKSIMKIFFSIVWRTTGLSLVPQLSLAIKKLS